MRKKSLLKIEGDEPSSLMQTSFSVDWISATIKENEKAKEFNFVRAFDDISSRREVKALHGYNRAFRWQFGALMMWHDNKPSMGVHFILSGSALRALHEAGYDGIFLIRRFVLCQAKLTMVHLAMDVMNSAIDPSELYALHIGKQFTGRSQTSSLIQNSFGGKTCYIGSWNSARFYRVYDKAAEQSIDGLNWKRIELVLKQEYAQAFSYKFALENTVERAIELFKGTVRAMADFNKEDWIAALRGETAKLSLPEAKERKTREWLLTQVAPAMARYVVETGDDSLLDDFAREFDTQYQKKSQESL